MPIYEITPDKNHLRKIEETSFKTAGIRERDDLQRLLRDQIEIILPDTRIIAEEFGEWEDSRRRIDLLGIDKDANLVVFELKRTEDGGYMDLQALRYAAMVSIMTFDKAVAVYSNYLQNLGGDRDAERELLDFLDWEESQDDQFAQAVRIVLVSAEFSKELISTVIWLNNLGLDILCVRLKPYRDNGRTLVDVQKVIPLPEARQFQEQIRVKEMQEQIARTSKLEQVKYDVTVYGITEKNLSRGRALFFVVKNLCAKGVSPVQIIELMPWQPRRMFLEIDGRVNAKKFMELAETEEERNGSTFYQHRWYCDDKELIHREDKTYAMRRPWGKKSIVALDTLKKNFPEAQIEYRECDEV